MFHRYGKKTHSSRLKDLKKILTIDQLLSEDKRATVVEQIKQLCALEADRFNSLCKPLIDNLANHYQLLPDVIIKNLDLKLFDQALYRTEAALNLFKQFLLAEEESLSEEQQLWQYALYSASLLQGIGKLQTDLNVDIFDNYGVYLKKWYPANESLAITGSYYSYTFTKETDTAFRNNMNIVLAHLLMPSNGFSWLASNPVVFRVWLALLHEDEEGSGSFGAILKRANALILQKFLHLLPKNYFSRNRYAVSTFTGGRPESIEAIEQLLGLQFIQWLHESLASGKIAINKAPLLMVPGGLLMCPDIFKYFIRSHPEYKNWEAIQNGFLSLGLHQINADGSIISRHEQGNSQHMYSGVVFSEFELILPEEVQFHHQNTGITEAISALKLMHPSEEWQSYELPSNQKTFGREF